jgi:type VI secretion system secreted protein VgrG
VVLEAGSEITVKVGGSFIKVDPSGVTLVGPTIKMNSGGSPGSGTGWAGSAPILPGNVAVPVAPPATIAVPSVKNTMESMLPLAKACPLADKGVS